jgi:hypothetical protein
MTYWAAAGWDEEISDRARIILEHLCEVYKEELDEAQPAPTKIASTAQTTSPSKGIWRPALAGASGSSTIKKIQTELEVYFSGIYAMAEDDDDVLGWWKVAHISSISCFLANLLVLDACNPFPYPIPNCARRPRNSWGEHCRGAAVL